MNSKAVSIFSVVCCLMLSCSISQLKAIKKIDFYVASDGNDSWSGKSCSDQGDGETGPFKTIAKARDVIRDLKKDGNFPQEGITVNIKPGVYRLEETLEFTHEDSGTETGPVIYKGCDEEKAIISGGRAVKNWKRYKGSIFKATLETTGDKKLNITQLYYKAQPQHLARVPNYDTGNPLYGGFAYTTAAAPNNSSTQIEYDPNVIKAEKWSSPEIAIVDIFPSYNYGNRIALIESIDHNNGTIYLAESIGYTTYEGDRFYVRNIFEELDEPGEWFFDESDDTLYFWPPDNVGSINDEDVVFPLLDTLVKFKGNAEENKYVEHIKLQNCTWRFCNGTAVELKAARNCTIASNIIHHAGGSAVDLNVDCQKNLILANEISETGKDAVMLTGAPLKHERNSGNVISNNHIHHIGKVFKEVAGVHVKGTKGNVISHNLIHDCPRWGIMFNTGNSNVFEYNHLYNVNLETEDAGGINTCFNFGGWVMHLDIKNNKLSRGNIIRYNLVHDTGGYGKTGWWNTKKGVWNKPYYTWGIYLDLPTSGVHVYGNVVYNSDLGGFVIGGGQDNVAENNIFVGGDEAQVCFVKWEPLNDSNDIAIKFPMKGNRIERNIISYSKPKAFLYWFVYQYESKWSSDDVKFDNNLIYSNNQPIELNPVGGETRDDSWNWKGWLERGMDINSIVAEPMFVDAKNHDYHLKPESPAYKLGFKDIPFDKIGLYIDEYRKTVPNP